MDELARLEDAFSADPVTEEIPIVVLTSQVLTADDRERLNSRVRYLAEKTGFDRARFVQLVRHLCATEAHHGR